MLGLKQIFRFYVNASIHVALAVVSLYVLSVQNLNIALNKYIMGFLFFSTIVCYNFVKYGVEADKYLIVAKPSHKPIQIFSFLAFGFCLYFFFQLPTQLWFIIAVLTVVSTLYAIPFLPGTRNLRSLGGLKMFLVAAVWVGFTVVLPAVEHQLGISRNVVLLGIQNFILVLVLILPFEIRDLQFDAPDLKTLPQRFGIKNTKIIGYSLIFVHFLITYLRDTVTWTMVLQNFILSLLLIFMLYRTKKEQRPYFSSFWVEGIPILWVSLTILMGLIS